jgi:cysteine desulfurase
MPRIHFDHLAGTAVAPEVMAAMLPWFGEACANPSAGHQDGLGARQAVARAREQVARLVGAGSPDEILFTSGGTEAANLAIKGTAEACQRQGRHLVLSAVEHPAVAHSAESLATHGFAFTQVRVDREGRVDPAEVRAAVREDTVLIAIQHVNHDLGAIQPVAEIGRLAAERGVTFFVDATASGGWLPIDVQALGATLLALAPHRFHGPKGAGILYRHHRARLAPIQHGGPQEGGRRAGTENVPAIVGAGAAAELARAELATRMALTGRLQHSLWTGLAARVPCIRLNGPPPGPGRIPNSLNVSVEFVDGEALMLRCDLHGIAVATGSSCLGRNPRLPPSLAAIGLPPALARSNIILSLGAGNTEAEVDRFLDVFVAKVVAPLRALSPGWADCLAGRAPSLCRPTGA